MKNHKKYLTFDGKCAILIIVKDISHITQEKTSSKGVISMKQIITRLDPHLLREMCIRRKYYTKGDNRAYSSMLYRYEAEENLLAEEIFDLAEDIKAHSNTEAEVECWKEVE